MKTKTLMIITVSLCLTFHRAAYAETIKTLADNVQTIHNSIEARIFAYKKTRHYTAVEIGFTNPTDNYIEFTPREIYLDDEIKYSQGPLTVDQVRSIEQQKPGLALLPTALGVGLGIAALATSRSNSDLAFGLAMGALSAGGAALLTKGFENQAKQNKLIQFENNTITDIKRLPPGMTLGGVMYFPPTKKPKSLTIIAKAKNGRYEKKVFDLGQVKKKRK
ncbi:MAG: hypothetical protein HQM16_01790 [Deltaproteobacteria bacterium]|nr:hypothetical protein [Deltaproteobacteria bacterium]